MKVNLFKNSFTKKVIFRPLFWINWKIQSKRNIRNCYITYNGGWDGAGAQIHSQISILLFAHLFNMTYLHKPLTNIEHFKGDRKDWSNKWEQFFSIGKGEKRFDSEKIEDLKKVSPKISPLIWKKKDMVYQVSNCHNFTDLFPEYYYSIIGELKKKFNSSPKEIFGNKFSKKNFLTICVHIRRGDVNIHNQLNRFTSNQFIHRKLTLIISLMKQLGIEYELYIFSERIKEEFKELFDLGANLRLNENEFTTLNSLVNADIFFMAKSSFSFIAGLLNRGIVLYEPYWHEKLPHWIDLSIKDDILLSSIKVELSRKLSNESKKIN